MVQSQVNTHHCHARGCGKEVPPKLLMCARHWAMVPVSLRWPVIRNYRCGQCDDKRASRAWLVAAIAAINAVAAVDTPARGGGELMTLELRIQTTNPLNSRKHWKAVWREGERQKVIVRTAFWLYKLKGGDLLPAPPVDVTLTRISSHYTEMDEDGCAASLKHVRDQVSRELGVPDDGRKDLISFTVKQSRGLKHRVRVEIAAREIR